jgi:hypothetical protein
MSTEIRRRGGREVQGDWCKKKRLRTCVAPSLSAPAAVARAGLGSGLKDKGATLGPTQVLIDLLKEGLHICIALHSSSVVSF